MTTKQISEAVNRPVKTVQTWAKKLGAKMASVGAKVAASTSMHPADYDLEETISIIEIGMGKNAAAMFRENAKQKAPETIAEIVKATMAAFIPVIVAAVRGVALLEAPGFPAIPPPPLATRDELRRLVNQGAEVAGGFREAWGQLYGEVYYRLHRNVKECAKNRGMDTLDYIEEEGLLPEVVAIARVIFGRAA